MRPHRRKLVLGLALLLILCAAGTWGYLLARGPRLSEADLRNLAGIEITVLGSRPAQRNVVVLCRIKNHTGREADSVVFTAELTSMDGRPLAANPLGNVLALQPGESRATQVLVPLMSDPPPSYRATAKVSLVRWRDQ